MYIAQQKRKENIAEYILYLWQLEDLIRALQFSPDKICSQLVDPQCEGQEEITRQSLLVWYIEFGNLLKQEGKMESGHLAHTLHLIGDMQSLHNQLMELPVGAAYRALFNALSEELPRLRIVLARDGISDIELCFKALYGVMLYRMKGDESKLEAINDVISLVSPVVGELSKIYGQVERGEINLYAGEGEM